MSSVKTHEGGAGSCSLSEPTPTCPPVCPTWKGEGPGPGGVFLPSSSPHGRAGSWNTSPDIILFRASSLVCNRSSVNKRQGQSSRRSTDLILLSAWFFFLLLLPISFVSPSLFLPLVCSARLRLPAATLFLHNFFPAPLRSRTRRCGAGGLAC